MKDTPPIAKTPSQKKPRPFTHLEAMNLVPDNGKRIAYIPYLGYPGLYLVIKAREKEISEGFSKGKGKPDIIGRYWLHRLNFEGKQVDSRLGPFPKVSIEEAKAEYTKERALLKDNINPASHKAEANRAKKEAAAIVAEIEKAAIERTFEHVARRFVFWKQKNGNWTSPKQVKVQIGRLEQHVFPAIGHLDVSEIKKIDITNMIDAIRLKESNRHNGTMIETARKVKSMCKEIFAQAIDWSLTDANPVAALRKDYVPARRGEKFAHILNPKRLHDYLVMCHEYPTPLTRAALLVGVMCFVRPGELRSARWAHIDLDERKWVIPAKGMKMRREHIVPLSAQVVELLRELQGITGDFEYVFGGFKPMSENTVLKAMRVKGFSNKEMTGHGVRHLASTMLNEAEIFHFDAIERQLSHSDKNKIRATYNSAEHLPTRRVMLQQWANYLDALRQWKAGEPLPVITRPDP